MNILLHGPGCNLGEWYQMSTVGRICNRCTGCVGNSANAKCQRVFCTRSMPRIVIVITSDCQRWRSFGPRFHTSCTPPVLPMHRTARSNKIVGKLPDGLLYGERDGAVLNHGTVLTADDDSPSVVTPVIEYLFTSPDCRGPGHVSDSQPRFDSMITTGIVRFPS